MNIENKYIGITFGPISRLTESVKSTKALWASSYFFSYISREIIRPFKTRPFVYPLIDNDELWEIVNGIGCFPDRYVFKSEKGDTDKLQNQIDDVFISVSKKITEYINLPENTQDSKQKKENDIYRFIKNYIKVYFFEKCPEELVEKSDILLTKVNIPKEFNRIFDLLEMQDTYNLVEEENYLLHFFESKDLYKSFLVNDAFNNIEYFESLDKISKSEYGLQCPITPKAYHNYIAILSADGDHMTNTINQLIENERKVVELSERLFSFGQDVVKTINIKENYGARIIFAGGDDLLIFAPIKYGDNTVFDLVEKLNTTFNKHMAHLTPKPPTISFGIAIAYNKYPMGETLSQSKSFLDEAKNIYGRNSVVCQLQKHSGQSSKMYFKKDSNSYKKALELIKAYTDKDDMLISSLTHWINSNRQILSVILKEPTKCAERLKQYFDNSLNESIHHRMSAFITQVQIYILLFYSETQDTEATIESIITLLRIIHFINTERDE